MKWQIASLMRVSCEQHVCEFRVMVSFPPVDVSVLCKTIHHLDKAGSVCLMRKTQKGVKRVVYVS